MFRVSTTKNIGGAGRMFRDRLIVKGFKSSEAGHKWLNARGDNDYGVYDGPLKPGTYARAGGQWHNVKTLDPTILAHI